MRAARPDARAGDVFMPAAQGVIRDRIARGLRRHGLTPADLRAAELADRTDAGSFLLKVNGSFPWAAGAAMLPFILEALPPLPSELQYRIVGTDLVLIDDHADLNVDILPYAVADTR